MFLLFRTPSKVILPQRIESDIQLFKILSVPPPWDADLFLLSTSFRFPPAAKYLELRFNRATRLLGTVLFIVQTVSKTPVKT